MIMETHRIAVELDRIVGGEELHVMRRLRLADPSHGG
jgi:hypothetical protein